MYTDMYKTDFANVPCFQCKSNCKQVIKFTRGDTLFLNFTIQDLDLMDPTATISIIFYNYEFDIVHQETFYVTELNDLTMHYMLDAEPAKEIFSKGLYYCGLLHRHISEGYEVVKTLLNPTQCKIDVL